MEYTVEQFAILYSHQQCEEFECLYILVNNCYILSDFSCLVVLRWHPIVAAMHFLND